MASVTIGPAWIGLAKRLTSAEAFALGVEILASHSSGGLIPFRSQAGRPLAVIIQGDSGTAAMPRRASEALEALGWNFIQDRPTATHGWLYVAPNADQLPRFRDLDRGAFIRETEANLNPRAVAFA